jgi:hypothetical protein
MQGGAFDNRDDHIAEIWPPWLAEDLKLKVTFMYWVTTSHWSPHYHTVATDDYSTTALCFYGFSFSSFQ